MTKPLKTDVWYDHNDKIIDVLSDDEDILFSQYLPDNATDADRTIKSVQREARAMLVWVARAKRERGYDD